MSGQNISLLALNGTAAGAITTCHFVTPGFAEAGAGANTLGVCRQTAVLGDKITVDVLGTAVVEAGAAVNAGDSLMTDATGRALTWAVSGAKVALALQAATAAGQLIEVLLIPNVA